jgi:superfamily I DNA/RNA helicase
MLAFDRRYEDAAVHRMGVNFRSDQQIVLSGDGLIQRNKARAKKTMEAFSKQPGEIRIIDISAAMQGQFLLDQARRFCKKQEGGRIRRALPSCTETTFPPYCHWLTFSKTTFPSSAIRCSMF